MTATVVVDMPTVDEAMESQQNQYFVADGLYRIAYRIPGSKWLYKYQQGQRGYLQNAKEYANYLRLSNTVLPDNIALPEMHFLSVNGEDVIAAEYIDGNRGAMIHVGNRNCKCENYALGYCWKELARDFEAAYDISDLNGGNVIVHKQNKKMYVIDLGGVF